MKRLAIAALLSLIAWSAHAQQSSWLWWGTNSNTTVPVSAANPLPVTGTAPGPGTVTNAMLATMATNTIKGNATAGSASPTDLAIGSCSTASSALTWTTNTGFGCNSISSYTAPTLGSISIGSGATVTALTGFASLGITAPAANSTALTISGASHTGSNALPDISISTTWNTSGVANGILFNVATDTAHGALSKLMDLQVAGSSMFATGFRTANSTSLPMIWLGQATPSSTNYTLQLNGATVTLNAPATGGISFNVNDGTNIMLLDSSLNVLLGTGTIATNATNGFAWIRSGAGAPNGAVAATGSKSGLVPLYYDTTNHQLWIFDGAWLQPKTPAGAALVNWQ